MKKNVEINKKIKLPKQGKLIQTSEQLCQKCWFHTLIGGKYCVCNYILMTYKMRGCEVGWCNKFKNIDEKKCKKC